VLALFRTNQVAFSILLLIYASILRISYFLGNSPIDIANDGVLASLVKNYIGDGTIGTGIFTLLVVFVQALLVNNLANKYRLFKEITLFPGLFYILLVSCIQDFLPLSAVLLGNTFLILALTNLLSIFKNAKCADAIFNVGFWIGVSALFYHAFVLFLLLGLLGIIVLRSFKVKEAFMLISGYLLPFIFVSVYYFWQDGFQAYWQAHFFDQFNLLDLPPSRGWNTYYKFIILGLLIVMGLFNPYTFEKSYKIRNYMNIFYTTLIISGFTFLFQENIQLNHFLIIATPLSILLAACFLAMSKTTAEFIHLFLFIAIMLFQFNVFSF